MYTIKRAAELTGIPAATLRAWERRYGIGQPLRTDSGYRLYDERSLTDLRAMQRLLDAGWAARQAAAEVLRRSGVREPAPVVPEDASAATFIAAARAMDDAALRAVLDAGFALATFETVIDNWLAPILRELGAAWSTGDIDIASEHFASAAVMRRLGQAFEAAPLVAGAPRVLVGLPAGSFHEIGALSFATAARRAGLGAVYVGANLPTESWLSRLDSDPVGAVVLSVVTEAEAPVAVTLARALHAAHPVLTVAVGGPCAPLLADDALVLAGGVGASAEQLLTALRAIPVSGGRP